MRLRNVFLGGLAIVAIVLVLGFQSRPDIPPLKGASPMVPLPGNNPFYWWVRPDELLVLRERKPCQFVRIRVSDKTEAPLPLLSQHFEQFDGLPETLRISRNGDYLLWASADKKRTLIARADGAEYQEVRHDMPTLPFWFDGSRRWVGFGVNSERIDGGYLFDRTKNSKKMSGFQPLAATYFLKPTETVGADYDGTNIDRAFVTSAGQFLAQLWRGPDEPTKFIKIGTAGMTASPFASNFATLPVPHVNNGAEIFYSPDETSMGWILKFRDPVSQNLGFGTTGFKKYYTGLWVTNRLNKVTRCLGYLETVRDDPKSGPYNVQFTPDAKSISYIYNNMLYLLPVSK